MGQISEKYHKDYKNITFDNPRLQRQRENRARRKKKLLFGFIVVGVLGFVYFLFFSPFFSIKKIEITGLNKVNPESIDNIVDQYRKERTFLVFSKNNFWVLDTSELIKEIEKQYFFDQLIVKRKFPATIKIILQEKQPAMTWLANNLCYNLDATGVAIEYCDNTTAAMTVRDLENRERVIGEEVLRGAEIGDLLFVDTRMQIILQNKLQITGYEKNKNFLVIKTNQLVEFRFDLETGIGEQLERLSLLFSRKDVVESIQTIQYIDLRFGEKIYLK